ncbi:nuclear transport factor 2 family protein [Streptosporangium sandarakinum]|uniref:nuclear transport factor 2 family protein n=1 Tax=Streptosporangium sandarakinum TaxID=1260955 RepID=UPI003723EE6D
MAGPVRACQTPIMIGVDAASALRRHVDAFNARDLDTLMAGFTDDASWVTGTSIVQGRGELTEFFAAAMAGLLPTLTIGAMSRTDRQGLAVDRAAAAHDRRQGTPLAQPG